MKIYFVAALMLAASIVIIVSCSKSNPAPAAATLDCSAVANKSFSVDVNPIVQSTCNQVGCHATGSLNGPGPLTNYTQVFNARVSIRPAIASGLMPQNSTLTAAQKNSILCWIDSGAPNN